MKIIENVTGIEFLSEVDALIPAMVNQDESLLLNRRIVFLSYYNHWLNAEEYSNLPINYESFLDENTTQEYLVFEKKVTKVFKEMFQQLQVIVTTLDPAIHKKLMPRKYYFADKFSELETIVIKALRLEKRVFFILPEYESVIQSNYDLTWLIWVLGKKSESLLNLLESNSLHLLHRRE